MESKTTDKPLKTTEKKTETKDETSKTTDELLEEIENYSVGMFVFIGERSFRGYRLRVKERSLIDELASRKDIIECMNKRYVDDVNNKTKGYYPRFAFAILDILLKVNPAD